MTALAVLYAGGEGIAHDPQTGEIAYTFKPARDHAPKRRGRPRRPKATVTKLPPPSRRIPALVDIEKAHHDKIAREAHALAAELGIISEKQSRALMAFMLIVKRSAPGKADRVVVTPMIDLVRIADCPEKSVQGVRRKLVAAGRMDVWDAAYPGKAATYKTCYARILGCVEALQGTADADASTEDFSPEWVPARAPHKRTLGRGSGSHPDSLSATAAAPTAVDAPPAAASSAPPSAESLAVPVVFFDHTEGGAQLDRLGVTPASSPAPAVADASPAAPAVDPTQSETAVPSGEKKATKGPAATPTADLGRSHESAAATFESGAARARAGDRARRHRERWDPGDHVLAELRAGAATPRSCASASGLNAANVLVREAMRSEGFAASVLADRKAHEAAERARKDRDDALARHRERTRPRTADELAALAVRQAAEAVMLAKWRPRFDAAPKDDLPSGYYEHPEYDGSVGFRRLGDPPSAMSFATEAELVQAAWADCWERAARDPGAGQGKSVAELLAAKRAGIAARAARAAAAAAASPVPQHVPGSAADIAAFKTGTRFARPDDFAPYDGKTPQQLATTWNRVLVSTGALPGPAPEYADEPGQLAA